MGFGNQFKNHNREILESRQFELYKTKGDRRSEFLRDYNRILHSNAYRRLKHKTQVFYNIDNDHICTRMEHVAHVESVSHSIALELGLDTELTKAIACGHDLGHAPFGHQGETELSNILKAHLSKEYQKSILGNDEKGKLFWHEKNGLRFVDYIELLDDPIGIPHNLNLTYAVRDGIVSHCGEIDENELRPREEYIDLENFKTPGQYAPYTWEGCVVKISDKIAYLGRDIEDALTLNFMSEEKKIELQDIAEKYCGCKTLNTTGIMHTMISDICQNSSPEKGICLSDEKLELFNTIKAFNYQAIYGSPLFATYLDYVRLVLGSIFEKLYQIYDGRQTIRRLIEAYEMHYPKLTQNFCCWLVQYSEAEMGQQLPKSWDRLMKPAQNIKIYGDLSNKDIYVQAIVDFISGMTDAFAITMFNELLSFS